MSEPSKYFEEWTPQRLIYALILFGTMLTLMTGFVAYKAGAHSRTDEVEALEARLLKSGAAYALLEDTIVGMQDLYGASFGLTSSTSAPSTHFLMNADWRELPHVEEVKVRGAEPCFSCHDSEFCALCHVGISR